ncbi:MAG: hypothetical protein HGA19_12580, partial [Oscillochloris sp.]|nr:hypothetical protein [Oscillochloris sp.]
APRTYLAREQLGLQIVNQSLADKVSWPENLARNSITSLLMFNFVGDGNARFGVPYQRHLGLMGGVLLIPALYLIFKSTAAPHTVNCSAPSGNGAQLALRLSVDRVCSPVVA